MERIDDFQGTDSYNHYAVGWAHAMDTPYQWTKQVASHWGWHAHRHDRVLAERLQRAERDPHAVRARDRCRGERCSTRRGLPAPTFVSGVQQTPLHGISMQYSFDDADADERRETHQYFEMFGSRGIYHKGETTVTKHKTAVDHGRRAGHRVRRRRLGITGTGEGRSQARSVRGASDTLRSQRLWLIEATRYNVLRSTIESRSGSSLTSLVGQR